MTFNESIIDAPLIQNSNELLINKVYNFTIGNSLKRFENIPFKEEFNYTIQFKILTPHSCNITITIIDPENSIYDVFYKVNFNHENGSSFLHYGAAATGPHTIIFDLDIDYNLNMYIKIEETVKCFYNVFLSQEIDNIKQYGIAKFEDSTSLIKNLVLETDISYKLYFALVSPISNKLINQEIDYDFYLTDLAQDILYDINWKHLLLTNIGEVSNFSFGVANGGVYMTNLTLQYDLNPVNIAFAIIYDFNIIEESDEDDSILEGSRLRFSIPAELVIGTMIGFGCLIFIAIGIILNKRLR
ncbi:MAG: hypothetical protein ACFFBP_06770 [Promethearchaeota archaeon]